MRAIRKVNYSLIAVGLLAVTFSYFKFSYCIESKFSGVAATSHGCYSDIPIFWNTHLLEAHIWPYEFFRIPELNQTINPVEYPFLTGFLMWLVSFITPSADSFGVNFFKINVIFISMIFIFSLILINSIKKKAFQYFALAPAVVLSLFINWDAWAVSAMLAAIYFFDQKKYLMSSFLLAISISFKFFPIVLLIPIILIGLNLTGLKKILVYIFNTFAIFGAINLPAAVFNFEGWFYFYKLSFQRNFGSGSIWEILKLGGINIYNINPIYIFSTLSVFLFFIIYVYKFEKSATLAEIAFYFIFAFVIFNKVYSPQYVIWLTALAVLILRNKREKIFFAIWQLGELVYHYAIWQYLYWQGFGNQVEGVSGDNYRWISLFRLVTLFSFTFIMVYPKIKSKNGRKG